MNERWGFMRDRWGNELRVGHLLLDNNTPACGATHHATPGMSVDVPTHLRCRRCERIAARDIKKEG